MKFRNFLDCDLIFFLGIRGKGYKVINYLKIVTWEKKIFAEFILCDSNLEGKICGSSFCNGLLKSRGKITNLIFYLTSILILIFSLSKKKFKLVAKIRKLYLWLKKSSCSIYICESLQNLPTWVIKMELILSNH